MKKRTIVVSALAVSVLGCSILLPNYLDINAKTLNSQIDNTIVTAPIPVVTATATETPANADKTITTDIPELERPAKYNMTLKQAPAQITDQDTIFNMMLNTIDYFNTASGTVRDKYSPDTEAAVISFAIDLASSESYVNTKTSLSESTSCLSGYYSLEYSNTDNICKNKILIYPEREISNQNSEDRITDDGEGNAVYTYREQPVDMGMSRCALQPEELTYNYLEDFSKWQISGEEDYIGRKCIRIEGTTNDYAHTKLNVANFTFLVDTKTGILLKYEGYDDSGNVTDSVIVDNIQIDCPKTDVAQVISENIKENKEIYQQCDGYNETITDRLTR